MPGTGYGGLVNAIDNGLLEFTARVRAGSTKPVRTQMSRIGNCRPCSEGACDRRISMAAGDEANGSDI